jgi:hypothetical protein
MFVLQLQLLLLPLLVLLVLEGNASRSMQLGQCEQESVNRTTHLPGEVNDVTVEHWVQLDVDNGTDVAEGEENQGEDGGIDGDHEQPSVDVVPVRKSALLLIDVWFHKFISIR